MPGAPDPLYVAARRTLLDALEAMETQLDAIVLVGAQAVYLHSGEGDLAVAPYTTDGDLVVRPSALAPYPLLETLLEAAGFQRVPNQIGSWDKSVPVRGVDRLMVVDLLVPAGVAGPGRRSVLIPPHDGHAARKAHGLEGALVDRDPHVLRAMEPDDHRFFTVSIAGPAALLISKVTKISERADSPSRRNDKDALDVLRLLRAFPSEEIRRRMERLRHDPMSADATAQVLDVIPRLFGTPESIGCVMAGRAAEPLEPADIIAASVAALAQDLIAAMGRSADGQEFEAGDG